MDDGTWVQQYPELHGMPNQQWRLIEIADIRYQGEFYQIQNVNSQLVLDVQHSVLTENTPIIQYHATGNDNQLWWFERLAHPDGTGFLYVVRPRHSLLAMNVAADNRLIRLVDVGVPIQASWQIQVAGYF